MSYLVLARKWRPLEFSDLVGQEHVARTLANAIATNRVAHAFLFTGVRGVGKTTSARILAKALNCMGDPERTPPGSDPGPTATPCLKCPACLEITRGSDVDVREIDGASYNGVDEVRKLQDGLPYRPARDRYKIVIVDEVHMLTPNAWNAFLKTLEEPPPHVKFIFATTEVHKVPVTILSRVQRFDFKLIGAQAIAARLRHVLSAEKIEADDAAIAVLSREAAGSMRDAMSLLDQVIAWGGTRLVGEEIARVLGVASHQALSDLTRALIGGEPARCLEIVADLAELGHDLPHLARDVLARLRDLAVARVGGDATRLLDLPAQEVDDVQALAATASLDELLRLYQGFAQGFDDVVRGGQPRAALEMLLLRLARRPPLVPLDTLLGRLAQLERRLSGAPGRPSGGAPRASGTPAGSAGGPSSPPPSAAPPSAAPSSAAVAAERAPRSVPARAAAEPEKRSSEDALGGLIARLASQRPDLAAKLEHAVLLEVTPGRLLLGWPPGGVVGAMIATPEATGALERAATELFGAPTRVLHEMDSARAAGKKTLSHLETEAREQRRREAYERARSHPRIAEAIEILDARLRDLRLAGGS